MKTYIMLALILLASCQTEQLTQEQVTYKDMCMSNNHGWMKMSELKQGQPTGNTCYGCMPDDKNHICTQQEYEEFIK